MYSSDLSRFANRCNCALYANKLLSDLINPYPSLFDILTSVGPVPLLWICNISCGSSVPIPTKPPSLTVRTSVVPSNKFIISAVPLCVTATPTIVLLSAPTSILSTPIKFVSSVVVVPSTVKLLVTLTS